MSLQVPGFRVLRLLGEGGMGRVYLAEDLALRRRVAIKILAEDLAADAEARARFQREAEVMATVDSPHVVRIHAFGETVGEIYFIMEYVEGESLARRLSREGRLSVDCALRIATECTEALAAAWSKDVVHRDVKPANVLLDREGAVHLADFGIARPLRPGQPITASGRSLLICTPHYVAPELARGEAHVDLRADVYSLGIVLFEMLTGQRPFRGRTPAAVIAEGLHAPLPDLRVLRPELSEPLVQLVERMTRKKPEHRPGSWRQLRESFEALRSGTAPADEMAVGRDRLTIPAFLSHDRARPQDAILPFVERHDELACLADRLGAAMDGLGSLVFVTGEAGTGKTALIAEFTRRARAKRSDLVVAGAGSAGGPGPRDPYSPFRETLCLLTGDVRAGFDAGALSRDEALRLWQLMPASVDALLDAGPDLIGTFVPGAPLLRRAREATPHGTPWLERLARHLEQGAAPAAARPIDWFAQYSRVLEQIARLRPLLLVLDDLQWADAGSIGLLAHLGASLSGRRILIVGAYRLSEVRATAASGPHPLEAIADELARRSMETSIHLRQEGPRSFVDSLLDCEPNQLDERFRSSLHDLTQGHPLFTVELLRSLKEQGGLARDTEDRWVATEGLRWDVMPPRIDAVIGARLHHLDKDALALLAAASVEGETFTAEAVADAIGRNRGEAVMALSAAIGAQHRVVRPLGLEEVADRRVSRFRFSHILFQRHLYGGLDDATRSYLHEAIGGALESLYGDAAPRIASELAVHFGRGGRTEKAIEYRILAAQKAALLFAADESVAQFDDAIEMLGRLDSTPERRRQQVSLMTSRAVPLILVRGWTADEVTAATARAVSLASCLEDCTESFDAHWLHGVCKDTRQEHTEAAAAARTALRIAEGLQDPVRLSIAHSIVGMSMFYEGRLAEAKRLLELCFNEAGRSADGAPHLAIVHHPESVARAWLGTSLRLLGLHDQAMEVLDRAVTCGEKSAHLIARMITLWHRTLACVEYGDLRGARNGLAQLEAMVAEKEQVFFRALALHLRGCLLAEASAQLDAVALLQSSVDLQCRIGGRHPLSFVARDLARALGLAGDVDSGITVVDRAIAAVEETGDRYVEPELYRVRAELLLMRDATDAHHEAEALLERAIAVAQAQESKSWELRAAVVLATLWHGRGRHKQARDLLATTYTWFTEGLDTRDLRHAKALLEAWS